MKVLSRALLLMVVVAFAVPAAAQTHLSSDPKVKVARMLVTNQKFDAALKVLRILRRDNPDSTDILFLSALAAIGEAQKRKDEDERDKLLDEAIAALRTILIDRPELTRVRLELARAFFLKEDDDLARRHFEQVLASKPPAGVALNINRFLRKIRARKRWSFYLGASLAPDNNIGAQSDERIIYINRLPFRRNQEELTKSGVGIAVWAGGEYQHPIDERWRLRAGTHVSRRQYREEDFDQMTVGGHLGPRWLVDRTTEASLLAMVRQNWTGGEANYRDLGVRVEGKRRLNRRTLATARASRLERRYKERTWLDGPLTDLSLSARWLASPTIRFDATFGLGWVRPKTKRWRNSSRWTELGVATALPWGFTVGGAGTLRWTDYEGNWAPFVLGGGPRGDVTRSIRLNVHNRAFTVGGFSPQVSLVQEQRTTNAQLYDYERIFGELRFVRLF